MQREGAQHQNVNSSFVKGSTHIIQTPILKGYGKNGKSNGEKCKIRDLQIHYRLQIVLTDTDAARKKTANNNNNKKQSPNNYYIG